MLKHLQITFTLLIMCQSKQFALCLCLFILFIFLWLMVNTERVLLGSSFICKDVQIFSKNKNSGTSYLFPRINNSNGILILFLFVCDYLFCFFSVTYGKHRVLLASLFFAKMWKINVQERKSKKLFLFVPKNTMEVQDWNGILILEYTWYLWFQYLMTPLWHHKSGPQTCL